MAKKDKSKKAQDTSWEDEIETAPPTNQAADTTPVVEDKAPEPTGPVAPTEATEDDFGGGGLLGAIKKNQANKKKKGKKTAAPVAQNDHDVTPDGSGTPAGNSTPIGRAPAEITEIDDDDFGPVKKGKKGGKAIASPAPETATPNNEEAGMPRVKTKAEKEKEKKERDKQRKKELVCPEYILSCATIAD